MLLNSNQGLKNRFGEDELTNYFFEQIVQYAENNETERKEGFQDGKFHTIEWDTLRLNEVEVPFK
jgi:hypothetical protein